MSLDSSKSDARAETQTRPRRSQGQESFGLIIRHRALVPRLLNVGVGVYFRRRTVVCLSSWWPRDPQPGPLVTRQVPRSRLGATSPRPEPPFPRFSPPISSSLRDLIFDGEPCVQLVWQALVFVNSSGNSWSSQCSKSGEEITDSLNWITFPRYGHNQRKAVPLCRPTGSGRWATNQTPSSTCDHARHHPSTLSH